MTAGSFTVGGDPAPHAEVLVLAGDPPRLQEIVETGPDGRFESEAGQTLIGRTTAPPFAVAAAEGGSELAAPGPVRTVTLAFEGEAAPDRLRVFADPVDALPERLALLARQSGPGALRTHVFEVEGPRELVLAPGRWRIGGSHVIHERPMLTDPGPPNVVVCAARSGDADLPGDEVTGFELDVTADTALTLRLRPLGDAEL